VILKIYLVKIWRKTFSPFSKKFKINLIFVFLFLKNLGAGEDIQLYNSRIFYAGSCRDSPSLYSQIFPDKLDNALLEYLDLNNQAEHFKSIDR
jgi:hypothetical protein